MLRHLYAEIDATDERTARGEALRLLSQERVDAGALEALRAPDPVHRRGLAHGDARARRRFT